MIESMRFLIGRVDDKAIKYSKNDPQLISGMFSSDWRFYDIGEFAMTNLLFPPVLNSG